MVRRHAVHGPSDSQRKPGVRGKFVDLKVETENPLKSHRQEIKQPYANDFHRLSSSYRHVLGRHLTRKHGTGNREQATEAMGVSSL